MVKYVTLLIRRLAVEGLDVVCICMRYKQTQCWLVRLIDVYTNKDTI